MLRRFVLTAAFLLLSIPGLLSAQSDIAIKFYGTIQSANNAAAVINGQIVDIRSAEVNVPLIAGVVVQVQAVIQADGSLVAQQIDPVPLGLIPDSLR